MEGPTLPKLRFGKALWASVLRLKVLAAMAAMAAIS